jgi:hypothetical protein
MNSQQHNELNAIHSDTTNKLHEAREQGRGTYTSGDITFTYSLGLSSRISMFDTTDPYIIIDNLVKKYPLEEIDSSTVAKFKSQCKSILSSLYFSHVGDFSITTPYEEFWYNMQKVIIFDRRATMRSDPQAWAETLNSFHDVKPSIRKKIQSILTEYSSLDTNEFEFSPYATVLEKLHACGVDDVFYKKQEKTNMGKVTLVSGINHYSLLLFFLSIIYWYIRKETNLLSYTISISKNKQLENLHTFDLGGVYVRVTDVISLGGSSIEKNSLFYRTSDGKYIDQTKLSLVFDIAVEQLKLSQSEIAKLHLIGDSSLEALVSYLDSLKYRDVSFSDDSATI